MENLDVSKKELEIIKMGLKYSGSEANIYEATNKSLYKIFESLSKKELENKKKKIELLIKKQIPFFKNPIRTLLCEGKFIGYELEYDLNDIIWWNVCIPKEEKIKQLKVLKQKLIFLEKEGIIYGDLKDDNLLINSKTNEISFCDVDNVQIDNYRMDKILNVLQPLYNSNGIYKSDIHIYMHNLFTLNELICNSASYKEMLIFLKTINFESISPFNDKGNDVVKQIVKQNKNTRISPVYLIDNLNKVS